eukprot:6088160-Alexandrium_andersonii.AAC.1
MCIRDSPFGMHSACAPPTRPAEHPAPARPHGRHAAMVRFARAARALASRSRSKVRRCFRGTPRGWGR